LNRSGIEEVDPGGGVEPVTFDQSVPAPTSNSTLASIV
jgi:hypothetical protein